MSKSYLEYVHAAIEAYKNKDARALANFKYLAFINRRYQMKATHDQDLILNLFPILGIHQLTELIDRYNITSIEQFKQAIQSYQLKDAIAANALWQGQAAKQRVLRTNTAKTVEHIKRILAKIKIKANVVGEFARHQDTLSKLEFCIEITSTKDILIAKQALQQELLAETSITDTYIKANVKTESVVGFSVACDAYVARFIIIG